MVLESGTGSGSLTTSLARAVAPWGHVHTFEYHAQRAEAAADEFASNGLSGVVTTLQRDIETLGFPEALAGQADGVFLDLPGPHKVVASAAASLRADGVFVSFSPCIEQARAVLCGVPGFARPSIGSPVNFADCLIGSPVSSQSSGAPRPVRLLRSGRAEMTGKGWRDRRLRAAIHCHSGEDLVCQPSPWVPMAHGWLRLRGAPGSCLELTGP